MSTSSTTDARLLRTLSQVLGVDTSALDDDASPQSIGSWDSLNHLNLVLSLESEFGISLTPEETIAMSSVSAIRDILDRDRDADDGQEVVSFEDCREEHLLEVKAFIAKSYGANYVLGVNDDYFQWQYKRTDVSQGDDYHLRLALYEGRVVGFLGYIPVEHSLAGKNYRACWLANWMVDPDERQLGLGPLLVRNVSSQFEITLALGANPEARDVLSRMGWTDFGMLQRYVRVLDERAAGELAANPDFQWPAASPAHSTAISDVREVTRFGDSATALWDRLYGSDPMVSGTRRTAGFLNWRYPDHSQFDYQLLELPQSEGQLSGLAVYRLEKARNADIRIVRILELLGLEDAQRTLLDAIAEIAKTSNAVAIDYFCGGNHQPTLMADRGYLPHENQAANQIPILYQPIDRRRAGIRFLADVSQVPDAVFVDQWYVSKADGDQDRPN